ncbi:TPA: methyltransferase domain-containing protein [Pseudomonas putida]|uniref:class I SAM-dependent methyltransferase n=1 Tax=Pseudomonas putida TaxID=303 RepID=UPI00235C7C7D|nr:methyltransferase domain-containing protein [Pseudomonas putida]GLO09846.1 SAM-dependent methyltransferase [Pseudomonas putida]HDS0987065.1 methyltransferase domain-containing protein [Pseudomonas putida]HDS1803241.1 methyltransferase domain-containing protein [Pseudomonas putida]HDS1809224.1 methyltransferase domain-containing protein [Pseudomonas putida]
MTSWKAFYDRTDKRAPSVLLNRALDLASDLRPRLAIDLGCGTGNEAWQLIQAGWQVLAIDKEPEAIVRTMNKCSMDDARQLDARVADFEYLTELPPSNLIHAGLSLPFCHPSRFPYLWSQICKSLPTGGVFAGHFFGKKHSWASQKRMSFHSADDIEAMAAGFQVILLRETESSMIIDSELVNWHRIDVILRKDHPHTNSY